MLTRAHRLTDSQAFRRTVRHGARAAGPLVVVHVARAEVQVSQVGFVVGKTVGNSVTRSLVSRRLRHTMREHLHDVPTGTQVVVRALPGSATASYRQLSDEVVRCLSTAINRLRQQPTSL
ncbi:MAG: ribonuclease P protein component [Nocardioides sp.]